MDSLHNVYDVGPFDEIQGDWIIGIGAGAGGGGFDAWDVGEEGFGSGAAEAIAATDEEEVHGVFDVISFRDRVQNFPTVSYCCCFFD